MATPGFGHNGLAPPPAHNPIPTTDIESLVMEDPEQKTLIPELKELLVSLRDVKGEKEFQKALSAFRKTHRIMPKKSMLWHIYKDLPEHQKSPILDRVLVKKGVRSLSGVLVVTVLTGPYPSYIDEKTGERKVQRFSCKHNCYYCPNEPAHEGNNFVAQPRSYLHDEPGVLRANRCGFDAVTQFRERVNTYLANGHPIDKIELLVLGGTWSEYPHAYQREFIRDLFFAANTTFDEREERLSLEQEIEINMDTGARIIGVTLETRPDVIDLEEIARLRSYACTRLQIGVQHTDDAILDKISREHGVAETISALKLLKDNCFKVDIHLMPNLPGSTVEGDEAMFDSVLSDPELQADQWKIYPCSVVPWTVIEKWHQEGSYVPYPETDLFELILRVKSRVHPWIRLNRVIRDIPNSYISGGCSTTNLRQHLQREMAKRGECCRCMRCREVRGGEFTEPTLKVRKYAASGGWEYFISFESPDESKLYGFLRLRIPSGTSQVLDELRGCALLRELHVYGKLRKVGQDGKTQHMGLGAQMLAKAERLALWHGYTKMAVISGVGARRYYQKFGYVLKDTYQVKVLVRVRRWLFAAAAICAIGLGLELGLGSRQRGSASNPRN